MIEEEKRLVEQIKELNSAVKYHQTLMLPSNTKIFDKVIELIEKQQREIEYYKNHNKNKGEMLNKVLNEVKRSCVSKDKIKEKIKELENNMILFTNHKEKFNKYKYARDILEKILGEEDE